MRTKTTLAWIGIFVIAFIPAWLLLAFGPGDYSSITFTLGQMAGLIGMTLFAITFVLSTRASLVEELFGGLDKLLAAHGALGATAFVVILFHPILLVMKYLPDRAKLAALYILPGGFFSVDLGIYALLAMIVLIVLTLYSRMRYHTWKMSHELFGIVFLVAVFHVFLVRSQGSRDYIFAGYYVFAAVVSAIGIGGYLFSIALRRFIKTRQYRITKMTPHKDCIEARLAPKETGRPLHHRAGQFIFVKFDNKKTGRESHPFSIASGSGDGEMTIIMKELGDFTSRLQHLQVGDTVTVEGPYGRFHAERGFKEEIWIAGGIGITPFLALADDFRSAKSGHVDLYYAVSTTDDFVRLDELKAVAAANPRFHLYPWPSVEKGRLTIEQVGKLSAPLSGKRFYLCGPDALKESVRKALRETGITDTQVNDERFAFK